VCTWANGVTLVRVLACVAIFTVAGLRHSATLNLVGLGLYWALDVLDGWLARRLEQETRLGAQLDILSDRLLVTFFYLNHLALHPGLAAPIVLFLLHFVCVDHFLSNQFLTFHLLTPNHFDRVDVVAWKLNFSSVAKALNTGLVTMLMLLVRSPWPAMLVTLGLIAVKLYSVVRLRRVAA